MNGKFSREQTGAAAVENNALRERGRRGERIGRHVDASQAAARHLVGDQQIGVERIDHKIVNAGVRAGVQADQSGERRCGAERIGRAKQASDREHIVGSGSNAADA